MEASAIMKMVEDEFYNWFFIIDIIVRNDDITMRAVLKHTSKGALGQVLKSPNGKLDEETPEPSFLAESSSGHAFSIGGRSKGTIGIVLYSKAFRKCDAAEKRGE